MSDMAITGEIIMRGNNDSDEEGSVGDERENATQNESNIKADFNTPSTKTKSKLQLSRRLSAVSHVPLYNPPTTLNETEIETVNALLLKFPEPPVEIQVEASTPVFNFTMKSVTTSWRSMFNK